MKLIRSLSLILAVASAALADVEFLDPDAGATAKGGDTITVRWRDSGKEPRLSQLSKYDLYLCAGGDAADSYEELAHLIKEGSFARGTSVSFKIDPEVGSDDENAYFLKMVSKGPDAEIVNYSKRFTITQMTGTFPSNVRAGLLSVSDLNGPGFKIDEEQWALESEELRKRQVAPVAETTTSSATSSSTETSLPTGTSTSTTELAGLAETSTSTTSSLTETSTSQSSTSTSTTSTSALTEALPETATSTSTTSTSTATSTATSTSTTIDAAEFTVPYQDQLTGLTRYAPAAKRPGTTITAKSRTRQFPTSSYSVATTYLPEPTVEITVTATATFSTSSIENTASAAPQPDSDLKRFLKRWQD